MPSQTTADYKLRTLQISEITIGRDNPRRIDAGSADIKELADSIIASGVIEPVHVRRVGKGGSKYELIAGERRMVAAKIADCTEIPVIDHGVIGDDEAFEITFLENFGRKDLTVMEESLAVKMCMIKFGSSAKVAEKLGKSVRWVEQRANIQKGLSDEWKKKISLDLPLSAWPASHIALIARLPAHIQDECIDDFQYDDAVITLSEVQSKLADRVKLLDKAPWDMESKGLNKLNKAPACSKCRNRSSVQPGLWDNPDTDSEKYNRCLDVDCWHRKLHVHLETRIKELEGQYGTVIQLVCKNPSNYSVAKKQSDGRTCALIMHGAGLGELRWVKKKTDLSALKTSAGGSSSGGAAGTPGTKPKPKTLKVHREELNSKRWNEVLKEMVVLVKKSTADDITVRVVDRTLFIMNIAAMWGAKGGVCFYGPVAKKMQASYDRYLTMENPDEVQAAIDAALWEKVRPEVVQCVTYGDAITRVPKDKIDNAKIIAGYLGINIKAMLDRQKAAIKEPKSWAGLRADGTPKAAAKKKS